MFSDNSNILEIGAGSGRLADTFLSIHDNIKYVICDIPLALFISYFRLKNRFQNKKIFLALNLKSFEEFNLVLKNNDIVFIFPHQLKYIDRKYFDLTLSISALHEMERDVINSIDNIKGYQSLYFTVWKETGPFSLGTSYLQISYKIIGKKFSKETFSNYYSETYLVD